METMAEKSILPAIESYCGKLGGDIAKVKEVGGFMDYSEKKLTLICENLILP